MTFISLIHTEVDQSLTQ